MLEKRCSCGRVLQGIPHAVTVSPLEYNERCKCGAIWQWAYWEDRSGDSVTWSARRIDRSTTKGGGEEACA